MIYLSEIEPTLKTTLIIVFFIGITTVVLSRFYVFFEQIYAEKYKRPFFLNGIVFKRDVSDRQKTLLSTEFSFYNKLDHHQKSIFRHRVKTFIASKQFVGRDGLEVTEEMQLLVGATAVMLTFGFRNYHMPLIDKVIVYPTKYYSHINDTYHKGETNPMLKAIVFSWEDFLRGYHIGDDNLNLGIHEFGHVIHLNAFSNNDISSLIFRTEFFKLIKYLEAHEDIRERLIDSKYFRAYAYTNHYEFFAVLLENFIETPTQFKSHFPQLYSYVKDMLNFKFDGY